jgi:hypothetical protein
VGDEKLGWKGGREGRRERGREKIEKEMWKKSKKAIKEYKYKKRTAPASCLRKTANPSFVDKGRHRHCYGTDSHLLAYSVVLGKRTLWKA